MNCSESVQKIQEVKPIMPDPRPTATEIMSLCRYYRVRQWMDSLYMTEVGFAGGRVDLMVIDLRTFYVYGYEVKVSRADFASDKKWRSYVPFFNRFYFATPKGIIEPEELPPEIGLLECVSAGSYHGESHWQLNLAKKSRDIQTVFVPTTLGENHLLHVLLGYMRDFNWRHERFLHVSCPKCGTYCPTRDPRGLPFGHFDPNDAHKKDECASAMLEAANVSDTEPS